MNNLANRDDTNLFFEEHAQDLIKKRFDDAKKTNIDNRFEKTNEASIKIREGKGGQRWRYISRIDALQWLDKHFPLWSWNTDPNSFREYAGYVQCVGTLEVKTEQLVTRSITTYGSVEIRINSTTGQPVMMTYAKNCDTDALKRAVFTLGGFSDIYSDIDDETDFEMPTSNDIMWYFDKVIPLVRNDMDGRKLADKFMKFLAGTITKEIIVEKLGIRG